MSGDALDVPTMSVTLHENRKSRTSLGSANVSLFHKPSHPDNVLSHLNIMRKQRMLTDVTLQAGDHSFPCHRYRVCIPFGSLAFCESDVRPWLPPTGLCWLRAVIIFKPCSAEAYAKAWTTT